MRIVPGIVSLLALFFFGVSAFSQGSPSGSIAGRITPADKVLSIKLYSATENELVKEMPHVWRRFKEYPISFDRATGKISAQNLPFDRYKIVLETPLGEIEGIDQFFEETGMPAFPTAALPEEQVKLIQESIDHLKLHEEKRKTLYITGIWGKTAAERKAVVYIILLMERPSTYPTPESVSTYRVEKWLYRWSGAWYRKKNEYLLLHRDMPTKRDFAKLTWIFEPALGNIDLSEEHPAAEVNYTIPEKFPPKKGFVPPHDDFFTQGFGDM